MLQYLLNASAIWLISLACFDLLLKKENYHGYNRVYLLSTFVMGLLLPLWQWQNDDMLHRTNLQSTVEQVVNTKQRIVTASSGSVAVSWEQWLMILYIAGAAIVFCLLITDIVKLAMLTVKGNRSRQKQWTIIETGTGHAPFSFFHTLFVDSKQQYNDEEWDMILAHEQRHTTLLHFADLLLMQIARIAFWFHPLVYVYNSRLLLVHEYQADDASAKEPVVYGRFLVEQAVLRAAPSITHSFNRSPIKNRIVMLTYRSTTSSRSKTLILLPLLLVSATCFSKNSFSSKFERDGKYVTYKGNKFELSEPKADTLLLTDPVTGEQITKIIKKDPIPVKMNGKPIPNEVDQSPSFTGVDKNLRTYLIKNMKTELSKLDDGQYTLNINNIVVDDKGRIVYFDYEDMKRSKTMEEVHDVKPTNVERVPAGPEIKVNFTSGPSVKNGPMTLKRNTNPAYYSEISKDNQEEIFNKVCRLIDAAPAYHPATVNGKGVVFTYYDVKFWNHFKVKDHKVYDVDNNLEYKEL